MSWQLLLQLASPHRTVLMTSYPMASFSFLLLLLPCGLLPLTPSPGTDFSPLCLSLFCPANQPGITWAGGGHLDLHVNSTSLGATGPWGPVFSITIHSKGQKPHKHDCLTELVASCSVETSASCFFSCRHLCISQINVSSPRNNPSSKPSLLLT